MLVLVQTASLPYLAPADGLGNAAEDGTNVWASATHIGDQGDASGSWLQPE